LVVASGTAGATSSLAAGGFSSFFPQPEHSVKVETKDKHTASTKSFLISDHLPSKDLQRFIDVDPLKPEL
jgi:hypothetical protein